MSTSVTVSWDIDPELQLDVDENRIEQAVHLTLRFRNFAAASVSVVVSGHKLVRELNREYLGHDYNTDVISFTLSEKDEPMDGEVYIDAETAAERADEFEATVDNEVLRYIIHGVLHLTGMDDGTEELRMSMREVEDHVLSRLNSSS